MNAFWRDEPLSVQEAELLDSVILAHRASVFRENPSTVAAIVASRGSGDYSKAIAACLMTIGGPHAPIASTMDYMSQEHPEESVPMFIASGIKVPGWGSSFVRDCPDPIWERCADMLARHFSAMALKIAAITAALHRAGKAIYPNPSCFTAAANLIVGIPSVIAPYLFVSGRLAGWSKLIIENAR